MCMRGMINIIMIDYDPMIEIWKGLLKMSHIAILNQKNKRF